MAERWAGEGASEEVVGAALRAFLVDEVLGRGAELSRDTPLAEVGVDSFALMEVVLFVERRFGVVLPVDCLTRENTRTVGALARCVSGWMAQADGAVRAAGAR